MARRPRPTPPTPIPPDDPAEFARPEDLETKAGGPEVFAIKTKGSNMISGAASTSRPQGG